MKENWTYKKLGEVCNIICGQDYKLVQDDNGTYPIYGTGGVMGRANQYRCPENSIIIGRKGNINNPIFVEEKFWNVDTAFGVVPNSSILYPKFFFYFCSNYNFTKHDVSVTIPSLRRTDILKIPVPVPPVEEQERIVEELDLLSGIIEKQKQQLKELDTLAQSIFYDTFGDPITNEKNWPLKKLGEIAQSDLGKTLNSSKDTGSLKPYLCAINIKWNFIDLTNLKEAKFNDSDILNYSVKKGDLLVCEGGDIGRAAIWKEDYSMLYQNALHRIRFYGSIIPVYCMYFLLELKCQGVLDAKYGKGVTIKHLVKSSLYSITVPIPPLSLQEEFAEKIEMIEKQKEAISKSIKETQLLFDYTMDKYFG